MDTGSTQAGFQSAPKILGLANAGFVVAWLENGSDIVGISRGSHVLGKIFDAAGNLLRGPFQLNSFATTDDERSFDLAVTHDGFAMILIDDEIADSNCTKLVFERFDFDGDRAPGRGGAAFVASGYSDTGFFDNPAIAANLKAAADSFFVPYEHEVGTNTDILAQVINEAGEPSPRFEAAQNSIDYDRPCRR